VRYATGNEDSGYDVTNATFENGMLTGASGYDVASITYYDIDGSREVRGFTFTNGETFDLTQGYGALASLRGANNMIGTAWAGAGNILDFKGFFIKKAQGQGGSTGDYLLAKIYWHNQFGGGDDYNINASTLDFSGTSQRELKLTGMKVGDSRNVNLFNSGINSISLAFGNLRMTYQGNNQFSIKSNRFDFDYQSKASFSRNAGTFVGGAVFDQFYTIPITPFGILRDVTGFGGSFMINFNGTVTISK